MKKIIMIEYDADNLDKCCIMKQGGEFNRGEIVVVLAHEISKLMGNEALEENILSVVLGKGDY